MSLNYAHTCPVIDKGIGEAKEDIRSVFDDIVYELNPMFYEVEDKKDKFVASWVDDLYSRIEGSFEDVRSTNEDMRKVADNQIEDLCDMIDDYKSEIEELKSEVSNLQETIYNLENSD